jgi:uncharacterized coiled-coil protein SlyX
MGTIPVYQSEIDAGIGGSIEKSIASVDGLVCVSDYKCESSDFDTTIRKLLSSADLQEVMNDINQPDLAYITSILVSTGWNKNDDVFLPEEVWSARQSPVHKPINIGHKDAEIIGHMISSRAVNKDGSDIVEDNTPETYDLEVVGVLYKDLSSYREKIEAILEAARNGKIFVSMEAWFDDFAYAMINPTTGESKVIERNEQTSFLTKYLRAYGGNGLYENIRIGRVLKNIVFAGKGIVSNPANPDSVIKEVAAKVAANEQVGGMETMAEENVDMQALQDKIDEVTKTLETKDAEIAELTQKVSESEAKLVDVQTKLDEVSAKLLESDKQLAEVTGRAETAEAELVGIRKNELARQRLAELAKVKSISDEAETLAELREMSEETFALILKYAGETKTNAGTEAETEKTDDSTSAEVLDDVKTEETPDLQGGNGETETVSVIKAAKATAECLLKRNSVIE